MNRHQNQMLLLVFVSVALVMVAIVAYTEHTQIVQLNQNLQGISNQLPDMTSTMNNPPPPPSMMPAPPQDTTSSMANPPVAVPSSSTQPIPSEPQPTSTVRSPFGPLVSPDGMWFVQHMMSQHPKTNGEVEIDHDIILKNTQDGTQKPVLHAVQYIENTFQPVPDKELATNWQMVGWSADGQSVYYVTEPFREDVSAFNADNVMAGSVLYQVNVASGAVQKMFQIADDPFEGIRDVYATKNILIYSQHINPSDVHGMNLFITDLSGNHPVQIFSISATDDRSLSSAIVSPDGTQIMITTSVIQGAGNTQTYSYQLQIYNILQKTVSALPESSFEINGHAPTDNVNPHWTSNTTYAFGPSVDNNAQPVEVNVP